MTDFNQKFQNKTKQISISIIKILSPLKYSDALSVIRKQIIRSATSVAANYRAVGRARSIKERYSKLCIVVEEADETLFWLEIIEELDYLPKSICKNLKIEAEEILKVMAAYKKKIGDSL